MSDLLIIVPSRGRPESLPRVAAAWHETGAFADGAGLVFVVDSDDPMYDGYRRWIAEHEGEPVTINLMNAGPWLPMVPKLNYAASIFADQGHAAIGFAGDDHLPRTKGWARRYLDALAEMGTGIVYGDDGFQGEKLPTQWAMTPDIIRALDGMVPAPVEHMFCDNAVRDLGRAAGCLRYLPDVMIEHMHPLAGKSQPDEGYRRVNRPEQYRRDHARYEEWRRTHLSVQADAVRALRPGAVRHGE